MKNKTNTVLHVWLLPLLMVIGCLAINLATGALDYTNISDERSQRDFNAALGMPLVIGYLWVSLRIMHRRAAMGIAEFLVNLQQVNAFKRHINVLERKLIRHVVLALALAIGVTLIYLVTEDLLAFNHPPSVLVLNMLAVPFWFLIFLFVMQSASFTRYLYRQLVLPNISEVNNISHCKIIYDLGVNNTVLCLLLFVLFPVFWLGKSVPVIDIAIIVVVTVVLLIMLFLPVLKMILLMKRQCHQSIQQLELRIEAQIIASQNDQSAYCSPERVNGLNQLVEDLKQLHFWPTDILPCLQILLLTIAIPVFSLLLSWSLV